MEQKPLSGSSVTCQESSPGGKRPKKDLPTTPTESEVFDSWTFLDDRPASRADEAVHLDDESNDTNNDNVDEILIREDNNLNDCQMGNTCYAIETKQTKDEHTDNDENEFSDGISIISDSDCGTDRLDHPCSPIPAPRRMFSLPLSPEPPITFVLENIYPITPPKTPQSLNIVLPKSDSSLPKSGIDYKDEQQLTRRNNKVDTRRNKITLWATVLAGLTGVALGNYFLKNLNVPVQISSLVKRIDELELENLQLKQDVLNLIEKVDDNIRWETKKYIERYTSDDRKRQNYKKEMWRNKGDKNKKTVWLGDDSSDDPVAILDKKYHSADYCKTHLTDDDLFENYLVKHCEETGKKQYSNEPLMEEHISEPESIFSDSIIKSTILRENPYFTESKENSPGKEKLTQSTIDTRKGADNKLSNKKHHDNPSAIDSSQNRPNDQKISKSDSEEFQPSKDNRRRPKDKYENPQLKPNDKRKNKFFKNKTDKFIGRNKELVDDFSESSEVNERITEYPEMGKSEKIKKNEHMDFVEKKHDRNYKKKLNENKKEKFQKKHNQKTSEDLDQDNVKKNEKSYDKNKANKKNKPKNKNENENRQKQKYDPEWHDKRMRAREESRKLEDKAEEKNWYLDRGSGREKERMRADDNLRRR